MDNFENIPMLSVIRTLCGIVGLPPIELKVNKIEFKEKPFWHATLKIGSALYSGAGGSSLEAAQAATENCVKSILFNNFLLIKHVPKMFELQPEKYFTTFGKIYLMQLPTFTKTTREENYEDSSGKSSTSVANSALNTNLKTLSGPKSFEDTSNMTASKNSNTSIFASNSNQDTSNMATIKENSSTSVNKANQESSFSEVAFEDTTITFELRSHSETSVPTIVFSENQDTSVAPATSEKISNMIALINNIPIAVPATNVPGTWNSEHVRPITIAANFEHYYICPNGKDINAVSDDDFDKNIFPYVKYFFKDFETTPPQEKNYDSATVKPNYVNDTSLYADVFSWESIEAKLMVVSIIIYPEPIEIPQSYKISCSDGAAIKSFKSEATISANAENMFEENKDQDNINGVSNDDFDENIFPNDKHYFKDFEATPPQEKICDYATVKVSCVDGISSFEKVLFWDYVEGKVMMVSVFVISESKEKKQSRKIGCGDGATIKSIKSDSTIIANDENVFDENKVQRMGRKIGSPKIEMPRSDKSVTASSDCDTPNLTMTPLSNDECETVLSNSISKKDCTYRPVPIKSNKYGGKKVCYRKKKQL